MKSLFLFSSLLIFSSSFAQSWRLIPENDTLYFTSIGKFAYSNWTNTDMVEISDYTLGVAEEKDSLGIHIQNLHRGWIPCGHCPGDTMGEWLVSNHYSWLGERLLYDNNGLVSGGKTGNEWTIDLDAGIGISWLWMEGDSMRLVSVGIDSIYGQTDSVRYYESDLGDRIKLSKSGGMLEFHFHKEHGYIYRYIGSQKKRDHCYIPTFHEYYTMNMEEWICAFTDNWETFDDSIDESEQIMRVPLKVDRFPDSIRTVYRHFHHYISHSLQGNPSDNKSSKSAYTATHLYLKSKYDSLTSPFIKRSLDGPVEFFGSLQHADDRHGVNFHYPCYIYPTKRPGFYSQAIYYSGNGRDSAGNRFILLPYTHFPFHSAHSILDGRIDNYFMGDFENSASGGICETYKLSDTIPDTTGYFPVGLPEMPEVGIYPNPFTNYLYISDITAYATWSLLNFQGQVIAAGLLESNQIEVNGLANGVYILQLHKTDGSSLFVRVNKSD